MTNTEQQNQANNPLPKLTFTKVKHYYWPSEEVLVLIFEDNKAISLHANFLRARLGLPWTPKSKQVA